MRIVRIILLRLISIPMFTILGIAGLLLFTFMGIEAAITGKTKISSKVGDVIEAVIP